MIITRAPMRISFAGGGTDIPSFYKKYGGSVLSTAVNKYVYIELHPYFFNDRIQLKYSKIENVNSFEKIEHDLFRCILQKYDLNGMECTCTADLPSGTGMGSSASFTVALLKAIDTARNVYRSKKLIAEEACEFEIEALGRPVGKQDQYASSFGGLNFITFSQDDTVHVEPIPISIDQRKLLNDNLVLFFTGSARHAHEILEDQAKSISKDQSKEKLLINIADLSHQLKEEILSNNIDSIGYFLHENWILKKEITEKISSSVIDEIYETAIQNGALGGKLLGAGGGGFFMFYCEKKNQSQLFKALYKLKHEPFLMDKNGVQVVFCEQ